jgi:hypothetical protein
MKQVLFFIAFAICSLGISNGAYGQDATMAAGGDATGGGGSVAYSVGQVAYTTNSGTTGSVSQGVQQTYVITTNGIDNPEIDLKLSAYPNPTTDFLTLSVEGSDAYKLTYQLSDMNGKILGNSKLSGPQTQISMQAFVPAMYHLKVLRGNHIIKTFTIIKTS